MSDFVYKVYKPYRPENNDRLALGAIEVIKRTAKQVTVKNCQASGYRTVIKESDYDKVYPTAKEAWEAALAEHDAKIKVASESLENLNSNRWFILGKLAEIKEG